ncbi:neutral endopeptidase O [Paenibacillus sp. NAIST15-1]|nr:neutral endopeptidase O [Paenibacillus sp. NAIST15-1]
MLLSNMMIDIETTAITTAVMIAAITDDFTINTFAKALEQLWNNTQSQTLLLIFRIHANAKLRPMI